MNLTSRLACAAAFAWLSTNANAQVTVSSGFEVGDVWLQMIFSPPPFSQSNIATTGGNPGRYAHMQPWLQNQTSASIGYVWSAPQIMITGFTSLSVQFEYKHFSGPQADFLPCLIQENKVFYPVTNFITLGTSASWAPVGSFSYPIPELSNLSGLTLNPQIPVGIGFFVRLTNPTPINVATQVGIDNITISLVPSPASVLPFLFLAHRRRR